MLAIAVDALEEELRCPICLDTLADPHLLGDCKHVFCKECCSAALYESDVCPLCRTRASRRSIQPDPFMASLVEEMRETCARLRAGDSLELPFVAPVEWRGRVKPVVPEPVSTRAYVERSSRPMELEEILSVHASIEAKAAELEHVNAQLGAAVLAGQSEAQNSSHRESLVSSERARPVDDTVQAPGSASACAHAPVPHATAAEPTGTPPQPAAAAHPTAAIAAAAAATAPMLPPTTRTPPSSPSHHRRSQRTQAAIAEDAALARRLQAAESLRRSTRHELAAALAGSLLADSGQTAGGGNDAAGAGHASTRATAAQGSALDAVATAATSDAAGIREHGVGTASSRSAATSVEGHPAVHSQSRGAGLARCSPGQGPAAARAAARAAAAHLPRGWKMDRSRAEAHTAVGGGCDVADLRAVANDEQRRDKGTDADGEHAPFRALVGASAGGKAEHGEKRSCAGGGSSVEAECFSSAAAPRRSMRNAEQSPAAPAAAGSSVGGMSSRRRESARKVERRVCVDGQASDGETAQPVEPATRAPAGTLRSKAAARSSAMGTGADGTPCERELAPSRAGGAMASTRAGGGTAPDSKPTPDGTVDEDDEERCCICGRDDEGEDDAIVMCDGCNIAVHQTCYGLFRIPAGDWYCEPCAAKRAATARKATLPPLSCPVCPRTDGAFKRTLNGGYGGWAHASCTYFHTGPGFDDPDRIQSPAGFERILAGLCAPSVKCAYCKQPEDKRMGARVQCADRKCRTAFHPSCAIIEGCFAEINDQTIWCAAQPAPWACRCGL